MRPAEWLRIDDVGHFKLNPAVTAGPAVDLDIAWRLQGIGEFMAACTGWAGDYHGMRNINLDSVPDFGVSIS
jgi:hypothetical protein